MNQHVSRRTVLTLGAVAAGGVLLGRTALAAATGRRVVVWSEGTAPKNVYPKDISGAVAEGLKPLQSQGWEVVAAALTDADQGVSEDSLSKTDVLIWWGHKLHGKVKDETVERIVRRVKDGGMGFIALHSSHFAKPLKKLLGTPCGWKGGYFEDGSALKMIVKDKEHPIARGVSDFDLPHTERYSEPFQVPSPESLVFDGTYTRHDGTKEQARQGLVWTIGKGKVFYFQPGHETYPIFFDENVRKIMLNAVLWMAPKK
jgi:trehalose utilization protein